ncbi:hypothetical protein IMG5_167650 [Ichthyophthirius multifiliis]|uniref:Cilia- and flagella-associated protein 52 n=1 Tax=Ichthyophthirius multifiliis TaxID=5932 RepID=G0R0Z1_ICHMU|nr:hypothetical protein IMG5_167650 [Ichthyophthirius multifiliis]EGR28856.1 hypothetical protein IMG5_167650 [Ichthyophthirius multifiliis]|eukprot:XP_004030092.1 hypothetical protein IMG5_167650 [Ichthyophthirius multifiliis]
MLYNIETIPKEINFILPKDVSFYEKYQWIFMSYQHESIENFQLQQQEQENKLKQVQKEKVEQAQKILKSILKKQPKDIQEENQQNIEQQEEQMLKIPPQPFQQDENVNKNIQNIPLIEYYQENTFEKNNQQFSLKPHPILELSHIQGFTFKNSNFSAYGKTNIAYSSGSTLILQDLKTREQQYFFSSQKQEITCINSLYNQNLIIASDKNQISYWNVQTQQKVGFYYTGLNEITSQDAAFYKNDIYICLVGNDERQNIYKNQKIIIIKGDTVTCKVGSTVNITKVSFIDRKDIQKGIISIGKENVRFWNLKGSILQHSSVFLGEHARDSIFTDFVISEEKALVVNNKGNLYIIDVQQKELLGVFLIHQESIKSIGVYFDNDKNENFIITSANNGLLKVWKSDFAEILLEVKLDSQVEKIQTNNYIVCACLNGTIGVLNIEKKKIAYITRSHNEKILDMKYHSYAKKIISISEDYSIKIWDLLKLKSNNNIFFQQIYEFKCLDKQVCSLATFRNFQGFLCGFEGGNVRLFDLKNFSVLRDFDNHKDKILSLDISNQDKLFLSLDGQKLAFFNKEFECVKEILNKENYKFMQAQFDLLGEYFFILVQGGFQINFFSQNSYVLLFCINSNEEIQKIRFSFIKEDLFITTLNGKLKKYKIKNNKQVLLFREYQNNIFANNLSISENSSFIFILSNFNNRFLMKIYDYYFRGGLEPYFQAFNCGEQLQEIVFSNDELNLVFAFSNENKSLYCWKFLGQPILNRPAEEDEQNKIIEDKEEKLIFEPSIQINNKDNFIQQQNKQQNEHQINIQSTNDQKNKNVIYNNDIEQGKNQNQNKNNFQNNNIYINNNQIQQQQQQQQQQQLQQQQQYCNQINVSYQLQQNHLLQLQNQNQNQNQLLNLHQNQQFRNVQMLKQQENQKEEDLLLQSNNPGEIEGITLFQRKPGEIFQMNSTIGFSTSLKFPLSKFIWNKIYRYIITYLDHILTINDINSQKKIQKVLIFPQQINSIDISPNCKFYYLSFSNHTIIFDSISHKQIIQINTENASLLEISPCSNYLLVSQMLKNTINVYELASQKLISCSILEKSFVSFKWNNATLGSLEFAVLFLQKVQFWRLNSRMTLEFQEPEIKNKQQLGNFNCLLYLILDNQHLLFVGTSLVIYIQLNKNLQKQIGSYLNI